MSTSLVTCPLCQANEFSSELQAFDFDTGRIPFTLVRCHGCQTVRVSPLLKSEELTAYYQSDYYGSPGQKKFAPPLEWLLGHFHAARAKKLLSFHANVGSHRATMPRVLDVGCGRGTFLKYLSRHRRALCVGLEIPGFEFPSDQDGVQFVHGKLEAVTEEPFDAISIWHVLEHLPDPKAALLAARRLLKPEGILAIAVPNYGSAQRKLFGRDWFHLDLPRHLFHFTPESLGRLLRETGFRSIDLRTGSWDQDIFGFIQSAQNLIFRETRKPNFLYSLLKSGGAQSDKQLSGGIRAIFFLVAAFLALPAILDYLIGRFTGRGGTVVCYARRD